jgi:hypothetical protein
MPVSNWSLNNVPLQYYKLGSKLQDQVPNPFYGQSQTFASQPTVPLYQLLGLSPQYQQVSPGQASWGKSFSNFFNIQIETRANHGFTFLASYAIRKTLTNTGGKDIQHIAANNQGYLQNPHNLMEGYGLALYEKPQTMKLNYSYDLPFGRGRQFMGAPNGFGANLLDGFVGGWGIAGITIWDPKGVPVLMPKMDIGVTAPGAALRWSLANSNYQKSNKNYSRAVYVRGSFINPGGAGVMNHEAFSPTPDYSLSNAPFVFPNLRAPGDFSTDATLLKKFPLADNAARYLEARIEATNVFNHPTYGTPGQNTVDADPDSPTFGGINGKTGSRVMQIGLRLFF